MKRVIRLRAQARILRNIAGKSEAGDERIRDQLLALGRECDDLAAACERPAIRTVKSSGAA